MRKRALLLGAVLALLAMADTARAQTATGQITGTVKDTTGAVVPGASVTVHSDLTGLTRTGATNPSGDYSFPLLPTGVYSVSAELTGFSVAKQSGIRLNVDQVARIDLTLAVGAGTETVEVRAATVALDTETATVGQVITEKQITDLPLNGRNFLSLLFLGAGAVETTGEQGGMRQGVGNAISLMGARPTSNNFMIDGTSNVDTALGTPAVDPVGGRHGGVQGADQDLLGGVRLQRQPDQPGEQVRDERVPRLALLLRPERGARREELLRPPRPAEARAGPEAVRRDDQRSDHQEQDLPARQLRGRADRAGVQHVLHRADRGPAGRPLHDDDHRSCHQAAFPEQHDPGRALLAPRSADDPERVVPRSE